MAARDAEPSLVALQETLYTSRNPTRRWMHRERFALIRDEIEAAAKSHPGGRALEVGPGAGPYVPELCERFASVLASDVEGRYLDYVRAGNGDRGNLTLREDDITCSHLEQESFDVVLCSEVIEHVPEPRKVLAGIFRLLKPGGTMLLSTPQSRSTVELLGRVAFRPGVIELTRAIYREPVLPTGHISLLSRRQLYGMIELAGFEIKSARLIGLYLPILAELGGELALRWEQRLARRIVGTRLQGLMWTQYWRATRPR